MQIKVFFYVLGAAAMLLLPSWLNDSRTEPSEAPAAQPAASAAPDGCYRVLCTETGQVAEIPVRDYLIGAVGAEMPASYEPDALRAQVIACHTYAERIRKMHADSPDPSLKGADFSDDSNVYQAFYTKAALQSFYGDAFAESYAKLSEAVDAVGNLLLYCNDEPIIAAFHAVSSGRTESAETLWGSPVPYLVTVPSEADRNAPQYEESAVLPLEAVRRALLSVRPDAVLPENPAEWFSCAERTPAGTVLHISCGDTVWSGEQLRQALSLRSACFTAEYADGAFKITTQGYGHGVGMSQFGADAMAKAGSSYAEILAHYYPGTVLCETAAVSDLQEP